MLGQLSRRYMVVGFFVGLLAPTGLILHAVIANRALDPVRLFVVLAVGGIVTFGVLGWIIGRRGEALIAHNRELEALSAGFKELSTIDALTGIFNRRGFDDRLRMELDRSKRYGAPCALVMIDLDRFKAVNDQFGHPAGDHILRRCAALLDSEKRSGDMVARYGGEEFAAILPHVDANAAQVWAERVRERLALESMCWKDADLSVTASFGVAATPMHGRTVAEIVEAADRALYEAKRRGGNHAVVVASRASASPGRPNHLAVLGR